MGAVDTAGTSCEVLVPVEFAVANPPPGPADEKPPAGVMVNV